MVVGEDRWCSTRPSSAARPAAGSLSAGMPTSSDNVTANIRVAIPDRGQVLSSFYVDRDGVNDLNGVDSAGRNAVIRDFRSGNLLTAPLVD